jgi:hypothetical protein
MEKLVFIFWGVVQVISIDNRSGLKSGFLRRSVQAEKRRLSKRRRGGNKKTLI